MTYPNYGLNPEVIDSYRRALTFNNSLLIQQFDQRYAFKTQEEMRKMIAHGALDARVKKYIDSREKSWAKRKAAYESGLNNTVEANVKRYAMSIRSVLGI